MKPSSEMKYNPREWQKTSFDVVSRCNSSDKSETVIVNACVGSGKTAVASYALGDFIIKNRDKKTFQMLVTPRIKLCKQQTDSIEADIEAMFGAKNHVDYEILRRDCSVDGGVKFNPHKQQYANHIILVICDESLWGKEDNSAVSTRFQSYMSFFESISNAGYSLGNAIFDEAHNFTSSHDKIFGKGH